jgi:hypothetical protein
VLVLLCGLPEALSAQPVPVQSGSAVWATADDHRLMLEQAGIRELCRYGVPERGGALWLDQQGSFMAAITAPPVSRLLGAGDLGRADDYASEKMAPVGAGLLDGAPARRQHGGVHTDGPNWRCAP